MILLLEEVDEHLDLMRRVVAGVGADLGAQRPVQDDEGDAEQGLGQQCPVPLPQAPGTGAIHRVDVLGGIIHDYERRVA